MILLIALMASIAQNTDLPVPIGKEDWILVDDYPEEAVRLQETGLVRLLLGVDKSGNVDKCTIEVSSTIPLLDSSTCAMLLDRAHFVPARGKDNMPIESVYPFFVSWTEFPKIPDRARTWVTYNGYPTSALRDHFEGRTYFVVTVNAGGRAEHCIILQSSGHKILDDATCKIVEEKTHFSPAHDKFGKPVVSRYNSSIEWKIPR